MAPLTAIQPHQVPILMYHEIAARTNTTSRLAVAPSTFAEQLTFLHDEGYRTLTAADLWQALSSPDHELPDNPVVLTFDDGYEDFHSQALPVLTRFGFTATVFTTTGWIQDAGRPPTVPRPGRMLSWSQVVEVADSGIEVAAHSHQHPKLDQIPPDQLREELTVSRAQLEDKLGSPVPGLAYPFGYSNAKVREAARGVGYTYACAVRNELLNEASDPMALPRLTVRQSTSMRTFSELVRGTNIGRIFLKDRALTKGWAVVRRSMAALPRVA